MIPRDCHGPLRGLAMTSLTAGSMREGFLQSFPNREARKKSARAEGERFFVEARFGERRNTLCISSSPNRWIGGKASGIRRRGFLQSFPPEGKLGRNQQERMARGFCRVEVWKAQAYFVYSKPSKPINWQKISGICRRGFLQSFPNREARKKSARAEGERSSSRRGLGNAGILCVFQVPRTDGSAKKLRHPPQMIFSELPNTKERGAAIAETE